jgi:hypothetical protein
MRGGSSDGGFCAGTMEAAGSTDARPWLQPSCPALSAACGRPPPPPQPRSGRRWRVSLSAACDCQAQAAVRPMLVSIAVPYAEPRTGGPRALGPQADVVPVGDPHPAPAMLSIVTETRAVQSPPAVRRTAYPWCAQTAPNCRCASTYSPNASTSTIASSWPVSDPLDVSGEQSTVQVSVNLGGRVPGALCRPFRMPQCPSC